MDIEKIRRLIRVSRGETPADLVLKGGRVINVFNGKILRTDVAVAEGRIAGLGLYRGREVLDCRGRFITPGFIDGHIHLESSLLTPSRLAPILVSCGTTTVVADPHEIANVKGLEGIRFMLRDSSRLPLEVFFTAPSCVPSTALETAGAVLTAPQLRLLLPHRRFLGLGEMMNFPAVLNGEKEVLSKISSFRKKTRDGHAPLLSGKDLCAYLSAGIGSDHECTRLAEAREKLSLGMWIMIRQGSQAKNLKDLLPLVSPAASRRCLLVSDDVTPEDLLQKGHLNTVLSKAVAWGLDPVTAIQLATLNPAEYFGLSDRGAIAPGRWADLVVLKDLDSFRVEAVFRKGRPVAREGHCLVDIHPPTGLESMSAMHIQDLHPERFRIRAGGKRARVVALVPGQILTRTVMRKVRNRRGWLTLDPHEDLSLLACVERHHGTGNIGLGLVSGFGPLRGAMASSVAHDSHNIVVVGQDAGDVFLAVKTLQEQGGGQVVVARGEVLAVLPLQVGGLMSDEEAERVVSQKQGLLRAASSIGCLVRDPFMALSFLALPVIPELKVTDRGLVDVNRFAFVSLFP